MLLKDFLPNPAFLDFVQLYRIAHFQFDRTAQVPMKAYPPKPEVCLHFVLRDRLELINCSNKDYQLPIVLAGQQTSVINRYAGRDFLGLQVVFQPTGLFLLTGIPASELTNKYIDAEYLFPKEIRHVHDQLQHAGSYNEMLTIADKFVANLIRYARSDAHPLDAVSRLMMQHQGNISLDWLAKESCLCTKQFKRKFFERSGVNPKTYTRIIRFTKAFNIRNRYPGAPWLRIAVECGYVDYQHLVKDYKDFTGLTPNEYHLLESKSPESTLGLTSDLYQSRFNENLRGF